MYQVFRNRQYLNDLLVRTYDLGALITLRYSTLFKLLTFKHPPLHNYTIKAGPYPIIRPINRKFCEYASLV